MSTHLIRMKSLQKPSTRHIRRSSKEIDMKHTRKRWLAVAIVPLVSSVCEGVFQVSSDYTGRCGLLDAGWACNRAEYIFEVLLSPFVLPTLTLYAIAWLLLVVMGAAIVRAIRAKTYSRR